MFAADGRVAGDVARIMIGVVSPGGELGLERDIGVAALDAGRVDLGVRDALLEPQERRAERAAGRRGSGSRTATGRRMTAWATRSQRRARRGFDAAADRPEAVHEGPAGTGR